MPTGQNKTGKHGGAGSRANMYKQLLLEQGVDLKAAKAMTNARYDDLSPYTRETRTGNKEKIPITSSEIVEMKKIAERQAKEYKSSGKYVPPFNPHLMVQNEYEYKKKQMTPSKTLEPSGRVRPVGGGGMSPVDIEKVPGKRPMKMAKGGMAKKPAVKKRRGYGIAKR